MRNSKQRLSKRLPSVAKTVHQILDARLEHKRATFAAAASAAWSTAGTLVSFTQAIAQGDEIFQRSGDMIILKRLTLRFLTSIVGAATAVSYRIIVFADSMAQNAAPTTADLLDSVTWLAAYNHPNRQRRRFKILHDKVYSNVLTSTSQEQMILLDFPLNHRVSYNGGTTTAANLSKGAVFALIISNISGSGSWTVLPDMEYLDA